MKVVSVREDCGKRRPNSNELKTDPYNKWVFQEVFDDK